MVNYLISYFNFPKQYPLRVNNFREVKSAFYSSRKLLLLSRSSFKYIGYLIGSSVTVALSMVGKSLIGSYLGQSNISGAIGAAGSVVIILLWVYYS